MAWGEVVQGAGDTAEMSKKCGTVPGATAGIRQMGERHHSVLGTADRIGGSMRGGPGITDRHNGIGERYHSMLGTADGMGERCLGLPVGWVRGIREGLRPRPGTVGWVRGVAGCLGPLLASPLGA